MSTKTSTTRVAVTGNTYPVKDQIKALGGRWDAARKAWMVPANRADEARALAGGTAKTTSSPRRSRGSANQDHEDCLSFAGGCGPRCPYAFGR